jgi:16S rRNA (cytosine967-C5)-methyltransferase
MPQEPCLTILQISLYQLLYLRIPDYAVVNSAVEIAKIKSKMQVKFVNAVLRSAIRKDFGKEKNNTPTQWIRVNVQKTNAEDLIKELNITPKKILFDKYILIENTAEVLKNPLFEKGFYSFQNPASYYIAKYCNIKPGDKICDCCAAPGGKTAMLAEENSEAFFVCTDNSKKRIEKLFDLQKRLNLKNVEIAQVNAEFPAFKNEFDYIIVDAPCSNMGVVERRPEAAVLVGAVPCGSYAPKQLSILNAVSVAIKPSGKIIYSVCSQEKEETLQVIEKFLKDNSNFILEESVFTSEDDMDIFFIAKLSITK